jgi:AraC-like DNA-binding protein
MLVLDTQTLPETERAEAFQAAVSANCSTSMASFEDPTSVHAEVHAYELGPAKVLNIDASGNTLRRTPRMARAMNECSIALALPMRSNNQLSWAQEERVFGPRDMILVDLSAHYVYRWQGMGASYAFHVDFEQLGLPMDTIQTAARQLHTSPIYPLVRDQIARITSEAHLVAGTAAGTHLGLACMELMHALIVSAAGDDRRSADAAHQTQAAQVQAYVRNHLHEPDLTPDRIAAANGVSVRALYLLFEELGRSLEQSIIEQRLAGARADLAAPRQRYSSVAATARAWGFTNASHFSSRFRAAYGMTPRQWRDANRPTDAERSGPRPGPR